MTARDALWDVALDKHGFVTIHDALDSGISRISVDMLVRRGTLERVATGVYRFPDFPDSQYGPYMLAVLWTGAQRACLSHDTALAVRELCDINPGRTHVTVPAGKRIRRAGGDLYLVHQQDLADDEIDWWEGIPTVTAATAIRQGVTSGVPDYLLHQALNTARSTGAITRDQNVDLSEALKGRHAQP